MEHKKYNAINQPVRKKDSMQLLFGKAGLCGGYRTERMP